MGRIFNAQLSEIFRYKLDANNDKSKKRSGKPTGFSAENDTILLDKWSKLYPQQFGEHS